MALCQSYDGTTFGKGKCVQPNEGYLCVVGGEQFATCADGLQCDQESGKCIDFAAVEA